MSDSAEEKEKLDPSSLRRDWLQAHVGREAARQYTFALDRLRQIVSDARKAPRLTEARKKTLDEIVASVVALNDALLDAMHIADDEIDAHAASEETNGELAAAILLLTADRAALLAKAGLTDAAWSAQGGACEAHFDDALTLAKDCRPPAPALHLGLLRGVARPHRRLYRRATGGGGARGAAAPATRLRRVVGLSGGADIRGVLDRRRLVSRRHRTSGACVNG